jgi:hypothetical protein
MTMAVDQGCDCVSVLGQDRLRSNHGCVRRRMIEAAIIRNRSLAKQRRYLSAGSQFSAGILIDALTVFGLKDVTRRAISARETSRLSAREAA